MVCQASTENHKLRGISREPSDNQQISSLHHVLIQDNTINDSLLEAFASKRRHEVGIASLLVVSWPSAEYWHVMIGTGATNEKHRGHESARHHVVDVSTVSEEAETRLMDVDDIAKVVEHKLNGLLAASEEGSLVVGERGANLHMLEAQVVHGFVQCDPDVDLNLSLLIVQVGKLGLDRNVAKAVASV